MMRFDWTLKARITACTVLGAIVLIGLGAGALWREQQMSQALRDIYEREVQPMQELQRIDATMKDVRFRLAGVLLDQMPVPGSRQHLQAAIREVPLAWSRYKGAQPARLPAERAELHTRMDKGMTRALEFMGQLDKAYARKEDKQLAGMLEDEWPQVHAALLKPMEALLPMAADSVKSTYEHHAAQSRQMVLVQAPMIAGVLAGFVLIAWWFVRTLTRGLGAADGAVRRLAGGDLGVRLPDQGRSEFASFARSFNSSMEQLTSAMDEIRQRAESIDLASGEIAQGNADLSTRTEHQASSLQQTAASTEELSGTVRQNHAHAADAAKFAGESAQQVQAVGETVQRAVATMGNIDDSARRIEQIIAVIDGIAFQTNILALNAAVEAARAGDAGRGFAVVASEVRTLAQRSADASKEIRTLIATSSRHVAEGGALVSSVGESMTRVMASVGEVATLVDAISQASLEQANGIAQISAAVTQMDGGTQQNSALVEQAAAASQSLRMQATGLRTLVDRFSTAV